VDRTIGIAIVDDGIIDVAIYGVVVAVGTAAKATGSRDTMEVCRQRVCWRQCNGGKGGVAKAWSYHHGPLTLLSLAALTA
jgi:hypothetical protein